MAIKLPTVTESNKAFQAANPQYGYGGASNPTTQKQLALNALNNYVAPVIAKNAPGIVPQVYPGSTGSGSNQNVSTNSYGGYTAPLPVTISSGQQNVSRSSPTVFPSVQQPTTITRSALGGGDLVSSPSSISGGGTQSLSLPSAPTSTNPGGINNTRLASAMAGYYKVNAKGELEQVVDPVKETDEQTATKTKSLMNSFLGKIPDINADSEVVAARQQRQQIQQALLAPTSELNAIIAKQNQDLLQLRKTGSEEGVTEAVYGGQTNAINYNAAIRALPLQARIAGLQGDLKLAQDYLSELTQIKTEQINNQYEYNKSLFNAISGAIEKKDERAYQELKAANERAYTEQKELIKTQGTLLSSAVSQKAPQSVINAINNAKDMKSAVIAAGQYGTDMLDRQYKQAQINKLNAETKVTFTPTQNNKGAANAGVPIETFNTFDDDTKNYFVNTSATTLQKNIKNTITTPLTDKSKTSEEIKAEIDSSTLVPGVKTYLKAKVDEVSGTIKPSWWDNVKSFFGR